MIYDPSTNTYIPDSLAIAEYLESQYPEAPQVFPHNTGGLIQAFSDMFLLRVVEARNLLTWNIFAKLNPASIGYYREVREKALGVKMEELVPDDQLVAELDRLKAILGKIDELYAKNGGKGPYIMGDVPSWADILVASVVVVFRVSYGDGSEIWKKIVSWNEGRWGILVDDMKRYE